MKIKLIFIFTILFFNPLLAQKEEDSLRTVWSNEKLHDTIRLDALYNLIDDHYLLKKADSALVLGRKMLEFAQSRKNLEFEIEAHTLIGEIYFEKEDSDNAEKSYNKGLELAKTIEDNIIYSDKLHRLGQIYYDNDDYTNAFKTYQKSRIVCRKVGDKAGEGWSVDRIGLIYRALGDLKESEKYQLEHLRLSTKYGIKHSISGAHGNLGGLYFKMGDIPKSLEHWKEGIRLAKELELPDYASIGTNNVINIYISEGQYGEAIKYLEELKDVAKITNVPWHETAILKYQCQINYGLGNYSKALEEGHEYLKIIEEKGWRPDSNLIKTLYLLNKKLNRPKVALEYLEKYQELIDDENEVKARSEIQNIVFNNQLETDSISRLKEKELLATTHASDLRKRNWEKNIFLIVGFLVLLLAVGLLYQLWYARKSKMKLNIEKNRAEKSEQIKQDFLANMSHEIRTPMNAVLGMTNLVLDSPLGEKQRYYLNGIKKSGDNLLHIINDILDLSKMEAGKMELDEIDFSIRESVDQVKQMLQHRAQEKDLELLTIIKPEVDDIVLGDPMRLNQVLINLIGNAIKFTLKGSVTLAIDQVEKGIQFKIVDTGIGIATDKLQTVFDSFSQANTSDTRKYGGTGLGLSISQQLVEMMQSTIEIESKEGYGTTFSFVVDFKKGSLERLKQRLSQDKNVDGSMLDGLKILIADDNEYNIIVARDTLKSKADLKIDEAINGQEAVDLIRKNEYDIVLMDVQMPVMNGFDATRFIRTNLESPKNEIPIIALTASVLRTDLDKCINAGMNSYLPKPFKAYQLFGEIAAVLNISKKK